MSANEGGMKVYFKVGIFTLCGLLLMVAVTVYVNDKPFWWKPCQLVHISVEDATGLKMKSPIRSLGLEIGYLKTVELSETHVSLGICITAAVEVLPSTRAYIRGEGFLGDKYVEIKPVKYVGPPVEHEPSEHDQERGFLFAPSNFTMAVFIGQFAAAAFGEDQATADEPSAPVEISTSPSPEHSPSPAPVATSSSPNTKPVPNKTPIHAGREIPVGSQSQDVQQLVSRVDSLVNEMTSLTSNLKQAINPEELRQTMRQLNKTLENASRTLSPEGGLNQTAQRTLAKLEDAIEQLRSLMTRVNKGEGSVGMLLNDPSYAEEIRDAIRNLNRLLSKVSGIRFTVDIGGERITGHDGGRGWFRVAIWPRQKRYYLLGLSVDPRGNRISLNTKTNTTTTTTTNGVASTTQEEKEEQKTQIEQTGILFTAMIGRVFYERLDLSIGALYGDGAVSIKTYFGAAEWKERFYLENDIYYRGGRGVDDRLFAVFHPLVGAFSGLYVKSGLEGIREVNNKIPYFYGAGIAFDDDDIKILFALR